MKKVLFVLLAAASINLSSCSEDPVSDKITIQQLLPLRTGNMWSFDAIEYDTSGSIRNRDTITISVVGETVFEGKPAFVAVASIENDTAILYYDGNAVYSSEGNDPTPDLFVMLPSEIDQPFVTRDTTYSDGYRSKEQLVLKSKNTSVSVPAGTFSCYTISEEYFYGPAVTFALKSYEKFDFAPNVGFVRQQYINFDYQNNPRVRSELRLISYTIVK